MPQIFLNVSLLFVFRGKSARLEQPAVSCVSGAVSSVRQVHYLEKSGCCDFNKSACMCEGTEPECRRTVGMLNYIKVDDCQSEQQIELHYCEVRDHTHTHTLLIRQVLAPQTLQVPFQVFQPLVQV